MPERPARAERDAAPAPEASSSRLASARYASPRRLLLVTAGAVFVAEALVMVVLRRWPPMAPPVDALVDATILTALVAPLLYRFLFHPMVRHIAARRQAEVGLKEAAAGLETRVAERTAELIAANATLNEEVTKRRSVEEALRVEKAYFEQLFNRSPLAIVLLDSSDVVTRVNRAFVSLFGYSSEEAIGKRVNDLIVPVEQRDEAWGLTERVTGGDPVAVEAVRRCKNGRTISVSIIGAPVVVGPGQLVVYGIYTDITDRRRTEHELERLIGELRAALAQVKSLSGMLPLCASCKKVRDDEGYWHQIEAYIRERSHTEFSHGICPECAAKLYPDFL